MGDKGYFTRLFFVLFCFFLKQTHLHSFFVFRDKGCSPFPDTGEEGTASTGKTYSLLLGSQREGKELFLCLLFLNCLQLKIILVVKVKCFGVTYSDPSGWWRRESAIYEIHSLTSVGVMVLQIARGQMPVIKCQKGHGYSTGQLSLTVIIIRPCRKACRILFPRPGIEPGPSAMEARSLNHWTAREFPWVIIKIASSVFMHVCVCVLNCVQLFMTPWTWPRQAPLSMEFFRPECWSTLPFPAPGDLPDSGIKPSSLAYPALAGAFFTNCTTWEARVFMVAANLLWCP